MREMDTAFMNAREAAKKTLVMQAPREQDGNLLPAFLAAGAMFLICMDTLIVNIALPSIVADLGGDLGEQQWIVDGYTLPLATLLLLAGNITDRIGAKRAFVLGMLVFGLASLVCTLAPSIFVVIVGRVLLGIGGAFVLPSSMSVIHEAYEEGPQRSFALAIWGVGGSAATAFGPLVGGFLTTLHWSLVFALNIPVCIIVVALSFKLGASRMNATPFDMASQILAILGVSGVVAGIIEGGDLGYNEPLPLALLLVGVVSLAVFAGRQHKAAHPMISPELLKPEGMRLALFGGFSMIFVWNGTIFLCTLYLQQKLGLSSVACGLVFAPAAIFSVVGNLASDRLSQARSRRFAIWLGLGILTCGYALIALVAFDFDLIGLTIAMSFVGFGGALTTPCLTSLVLVAAGVKYGGIASAVFNTMRQVGGAVGVALFGTLVGVCPAFETGMAVSLGVSLVLLFVMAGLLYRAQGI